MGGRGISGQIDGWSVQFYLLDRGWKGKIENTCGNKKLVPQLRIEPLPLACEASALSTEPSRPVVVEVTRMPIYTNALGSVPTLLPVILDLNSFFFLSPFCFSFYLLPPFLPFVLLTSPFFFIFSSFFFFFSSSSPSFFALLFYSFFFASFLLGMSDQPFEMSGHF